MHGDLVGLVHSILLETGLAPGRYTLFVPILYLAVPVKDKGGYGTAVPLERIAAHWVAVAAVVLLLLALYRELSWRWRASAPTAAAPAPARPAPPRTGAPAGPDRRLSCRH